MKSPGSPLGGGKTPGDFTKRCDPTRRNIAFRKGGKFLIGLWPLPFLIKQMI